MCVSTSATSPRSSSRRTRSSGTGRPDDAPRLRRLGAADVVDYQEDVAERVLAAHTNGVDALIDMVTFDPNTFAPLAKAVRPGGKISTLTGGATEEEPAARSSSTIND